MKMSSTVHFSLQSSFDDSECKTLNDLALRNNQRKHPKVELKRTFSLVPERFDPSLNTNASNKQVILLCEYLLKAFILLLIILTFPLSIFLLLRVIAQYQRAVVFRLGRLVSKEPLGPGLILVIPCLDTMKCIDLRTLTFDVPTQEVLTKDSVTVAVDAVVYYRIFDPVMSVVNVEDSNRSTRLLAQTTLRNVLGTVDLCSLLTDREDIAASMQETLDAATDAWGMKVERVEIKDVRLPTQLQRAMAAEAEATREAKAKIIASEGEKKSAKALRQAAEEIEKCPIAIQLRYLQTLSNISMEKNSTIIFPLPMDILHVFQPSRHHTYVDSPVNNNESIPIHIQMKNYGHFVIDDSPRINNCSYQSDSDFTV